MSLRCKLDWHRYEACYEASDVLELVPILIPFGVDFRVFPLLAPKRGAYLVVFCGRCGRKKEGS